MKMLLLAMNMIAAVACVLLSVFWVFMGLTHNAPAWKVILWVLWLAVLLAINMRNAYYLLGE